MLPGVTSAVWTVKKNVSDEYIVVSFANAILVVSIVDSGFLDTTPSLAVSLIGDESLMQVHTSGIRGKMAVLMSGGRLERTVVKVGSNRLKVVIALSGGELICFEVDATGQLMEVEMFGDVSCLDIAHVPERRQRSRFLAVGSYDNTICILSLDPDDPMQVLSLQSASSPPESLLFLNAGLQNGVLFRNVVDDPVSDEHYGYPKTESGKMVSCIRVLDPKTTHTTCLLELQDNEAAFSMCTVNFHDKESGTLLAVGTAKGLQFWPKRSFEAGYREEGKILELLHKTQVEGVPLALCKFQGRLLAGVGPVRLSYDLGKKRWFRICESKMHKSFAYFKNRRDENQLDEFADNTVPRSLTAVHHVASDTMAGSASDKFGNIYFVRLPQVVSDEVEEDPAGCTLKWEEGKLNKVEEIAQFHIGDVVTCLHKASLIPGGGECIIHWTVIGCLSVLLLFTSHADVDLFSHLEMHMRQEYHVS